MKGGDISSGLVQRILMPLDTILTLKNRLFRGPLVVMDQDALGFGASRWREYDGAIDFAAVRNLPASLSKYECKHDVEFYEDRMTAAGWSMPGRVLRFRNLEELHLYVRTTPNLQAYYDPLYDRRIRLVSSRTFEFPGWLNFRGGGS